MPEINYFWDEIEDNVVREYDENNNTVASYTSEPTVYGSVLSQDRRGEKRYFQFDGQGNTTELTAASGSTTDARRYSAFGEITEVSGTSEFHWCFHGAVGYCNSVPSEFLDVRRRRLSPERSRWLSVDPILDPLARNPYSHLMNRHSSFFDPSGELIVERLDKKPPDVNCGDRIIQNYRFSLSNQSTCKNGGWIIQHMHISCQSQPCDPTVACSDQGLFADSISFSYIEAFRIQLPKGSPFSAIDTNGIRINDHTCGTKHMHGIARFFCDERIPKGEPWKDYERKSPPYSYGREPCLYSAYYAPSLPQDYIPSWWHTNYERTEGTSSHEFRMTWQCCPCHDFFAVFLSLAKGNQPLALFERYPIVPGSIWHR